MRFGFLLKRGKPEARELAAKLGRILRGLGATLFALPDDAAAIPEASAVTDEELPGTIDALAVLGGDGTLLYGAALVADAGVPIFGVNLGSLGFMTSYARAEAESAIEEAARGKIPIEERIRLAVALRPPGGAAKPTRSAVNDAVITQRSIARLWDLEARLDDAEIATYKGDGVIIATPNGSTAYTLAAGGPVLTPDVEAMVLTPLCPHTLTHRPLVFRPDARLVVRNVSDSAVTLTIDGQWGYDMPSGASIEVRKAAKPLRLFRAPRGFFGVLREKLSWGERQG